MDNYSKTYEIRWSDLDANGHMNYAAYVDTTADLRFRFFTEHDFPTEKFAQIGISPIYTTVHAEFFREVLIGETMTITYTLSGLSPSGIRWKAHHDILKTNGKKAVSIDLEGAILNLVTRKPAPPTPELLQTMNLIPRTTDFEMLPEMRRMK